MDKSRDEQTISLDELLKNIHPHNKVMENGKAILLDFISHEDYRPSEVYAAATCFDAAIYFFAGGEPDIAIAVLDYGIQETKKLYEMGLAGEMPPVERIEQIVKALRKNRKKIPKIIRGVAQHMKYHAKKVTSFFRRTGCPSLPREVIERDPIYNLMTPFEEGFDIPCQCSKHRIKQEEAAIITAYLTVRPNTIRLLDL